MPHPPEEGEPLFTVRLDTYSPSSRPPHWDVSLPHQCDEWQIVWAADPQEAVDEMERFVSQAQDALARLRSMIGEQQ